MCERENERERESGALNSSTDAETDKITKHRTQTKQKKAT